MKIALYGATGNVARSILDEALTRGHEVTAVTRDPSHAPLPSHENLQVEQGDILIGVTALSGATTLSSAQSEHPEDLTEAC